MMPRGSEPAIVAAGLLYLVGLSVSMARVSYDIWGALIVIPIYGVIGVAAMRRMFRDHPPIATVMSVGLALKLGGAMARYWVGFEAYQGGIDAAAYHEFASEVAGGVWAGEMSVFDALPSGTGTDFVEHFTGFVYVLTGASQLAGFVTFAFFAYIGLACFVKAAIVAIPGLAARRYAWFCVTAPSVVYWPSSIGKEALMMFGLGVGTLGIALVFARGRLVGSFVLVAGGLGFASLIRPHMAAIWVAAALPGLIVAVLNRSRPGGDDRRAGRMGLLLALGAAVVAFAFVASITLEFLAPTTDDTENATDSLTQIFEETQRRTSQAGSNFTPPSVASPVSWPFAAVRTLTRPLPLEARGIAQLFSAAEIAVLLGVFMLSWRRVIHTVRLAYRNPFVTFVVTATFLTGLAYSSLANLGILTRQKSLILPFLLVLPSLPLPARPQLGRPSDAASDSDEIERATASGRRSAAGVR